MLFSYGEELLAFLPTNELEYHLLSAVCEGLFSIFTITLHPQLQNAPYMDNKEPGWCYERRKLSV
jgi:hypothetical protein